MRRSLGRRISVGGAVTTALGLAVTVTLLSLAGGCSSLADAPSGDERVTRSQQAIIGGALDTTHAAVVTLRSAPSGGGFFECSGTLVKIDPATGVGWVLTAGHCLSNWKPQTVLLGEDPEAPSTRRFSVLDGKTNYTGKPEVGAHDVAIVRILGVDATTPFVPLATASDGLSVGTSVVSVGYGRTTASGPDPAKQARRNITRNVSALGADFLRYEMSDGGVCSGDSGGPVILGTGASARVVGVHSFVEPDCLGVGTSVRVSGELVFLDAELAAPLPAMDTCRVCASRAESGDNTCAKRRDACVADKDCRALLDCRSACGSQACADQCANKHEAGAGPYLAFQSCSCQDACATECRDVAGCKSLPACGRAPLKDSACDACGGASCCAERRALSFESVGARCVANPSDPSCAASPSGKGYAACLERSCAAACGIAPPAAAAPAASVDAGGTSQAPTASDASDGGCAVAGRSTPEGLWALALAIVVRLGRRRRASAQGLLPSAGPAARR